MKHLPILFMIISCFSSAHACLSVLSVEGLEQGGVPVSSEVQQCERSHESVNLKIKEHGQVQSLSVKPDEFDHHWASVKLAFSEAKDLPVAKSGCRHPLTVKARWDGAVHQFTACEHQESAILATKVQQIIRNISLSSAH